MKQKEKTKTYKVCIIVEMDVKGIEETDELDEILAQALIHFDKQDYGEVDLHSVWDENGRRIG